MIAFPLADIHTFQQWFYQRFESRIDDRKPCESPCHFNLRTLPRCKPLAHAALMLLVGVRTGDGGDRPLRAKRDRSANIHYANSRASLSKDRLQQLPVCRYITGIGHAMQPNCH
jgi:hypothetical protein